MENMVSVDPRVVFPVGLFDYNVTSSNGYAPASMGCASSNYLATFGTIFLFTFFIAKLLRTEADGFASGHYLAWTWKLRTEWWYRYPILYGSLHLSMVLFSCAVVALRPEACEWVVNKYNPGHTYFCRVAAPALFDVLAQSYITWGLALYGFAGALKGSPPEFDWRSASFEKIRFKRSCFDILLESNDAFGTRLVHCLAKKSQPHLMKMLAEEKDDQYFLKTWDSGLEVGVGSEGSESGGSHGSDSAEVAVESDTAGSTSAENAPRKHLRLQLPTWFWFSHATARETS